MNPERMEEIKDRLDGGDESHYQTDVADLLRELSAYQHLILNILRNLETLEDGNLIQQKYLLTVIKGTLTTVAGAHDFGDNNAV